MHLCIYLFIFFTFYFYFTTNLCPIGLLLGTDRKPMVDAHIQRSPECSLGFLKQTVAGILSSTLVEGRTQFSQAGLKRG